jgi:hypothetical protein
MLYLMNVIMNLINISDNLIDNENIHLIIAI